MFPRSLINPSSRWTAQILPAIAFLLSFSIFLPSRGLLRLYFRTGLPCSVEIPSKSRYIHTIKSVHRSGYTRVIWRIIRAFQPANSGPRFDRYRPRILENISTAFADRHEILESPSANKADACGYPRESALDSKRIHFRACARPNLAGFGDGDVHRISVPQVCAHLQMPNTITVSETIIIFVVTHLFVARRKYCSGNGNKILVIWGHTG